MDNKKMPSKHQDIPEECRACRCSYCYKQEFCDRCSTCTKGSREKDHCDRFEGTFTY